MKSRLERLRKALVEELIPSLFISGLENIRYLSGFTGSAGFGWVSRDAALFFADSRYHIQAKAECPSFELVECQQKLLSETVEKLKSLGVGTIGVEKQFLTLAQHMEMESGLPGVELRPTDGVIEDLRRVKEPGEVAAIKKACELVDRTYQHILPFINEGVSERDVAIEIDFFMRRNGADKPGFDSIVAFGPHSAYPHARPTGLSLGPGQFVKMDFGAQLAGYNSDITRTIVFGPETARHKEIYEIVREAQQRALDAIRPGRLGREVDAAARDHITEKGYGDQFGHGLGHELGREVHDGGRLNKASEIVLAPGQVWTVEPGIYVEGFGGVRIEDDVVVTEDGCEILTSAPKQLTVID